MQYLWEKIYGCDRMQVAGTMEKELAAHIHGWEFAGFSVKFCDETGDKDVR